MPERVRSGIIARYARSNLHLPSTSFLHSASERLSSKPSRTGGHFVEVRLSRRNQTKINDPKVSEKKLWKFLVANVVDAQRAANLRQGDVQIIEIQNRGKAGVTLNAQPVRAQGWFRYDSDMEYTGRLSRTFAVSFGSRSGYEVVVYMERWVATTNIDDTDYDVDTHLAPKLEAVPLKALSCWLWPVPHSRTNAPPTLLRLLFVKDL